MMQNKGEKWLKKAILIIAVSLIAIVLVGLRMLPKIYPQKHKDIVAKYSEEYKIDSLLIYSIIKTESNFKAEAKSTSNAIGLMQIMISTAKEVEKKEISEAELYDEETNIRIGVKYFKNLLEKYNNYNLAIIAYNAGMGNVDKWLKEGTIDKDGKQIENIPFLETKNYVKKVLLNYKIYKEIY